MCSHEFVCIVEKKKNKKIRSIDDNIAVFYFKSQLNILFYCNYKYIFFHISLENPFENQNHKIRASFYFFSIHLKTKLIKLKKKRNETAIEIKKYENRKYYEKNIEL